MQLSFLRFYRGKNDRPSHVQNKLDMRYVQYKHCDHIVIFSSTTAMLRVTIQTPQFVCFAMRALQTSSTQSPHLNHSWIDAC